MQVLSRLLTVKRSDKPPSAPSRRLDDGPGLASRTVSCRRDDRHKPYLSRRVPGADLRPPFETPIISPRAILSFQFLTDTNPTASALRSEPSAHWS